MFFSTLPDDYETKLKDEIYGCFKYIGIPIETLYHMTVQDRRYFILRHNAEQQRIELEQESNKNGNSINANLNEYAKLDQQNNMQR